MQLFQKFINHTQRVFRGACLKGDKLPKVDPFIVNAVDTTSVEVHPVVTPTIYVDEPLDTPSVACYTAYPAFNASEGSLSSPALSYNPSFFSQDNSSTCTRLTVPTPILSPMSCLPPTIACSDLECDESENGIYGLDPEDDEYLYETGGGMFGAKVSEISCPASDSVCFEVDDEQYLAPLRECGMKATEQKQTTEKKVQAATEDVAAKNSAARGSIFWDCGDVRVPLLSWNTGN